MARYFVVSRNQNRSFINLARLGATLVLLYFLFPVLTDTAWCQTRDDFARAKIRNLEARLWMLERFSRNIICGRVDEDVLKDGTFIYAMGCPQENDRNSQDYKGPGLKATLARPGAFRFEFSPPRLQKPIVLATASNAWGDIPVETSSLRVIDVSESGFAVERVDSGSVNPKYVSFFFLVLFGEPSRR